MLPVEYDTPAEYFHPNTYVFTPPDTHFFYHTAKYGTYAICVSPIFVPPIPTTSSAAQAQPAAELLARPKQRVQHARRVRA